MHSSLHSRKPLSTPLEVETRCRRVTAEDIAAVTPADIAAIQSQMTPEQLRAALRVMADHNKVGDVMMYADPKTFSAAVADVDQQSLRDASYRVTTSSALQANLLAHTTDEVRAECMAAQRQLQDAAGDSFA